VQEFHAAGRSRTWSWLFSSAQANTTLTSVAAEMRRLFAGVPSTSPCTTAGRNAGQPLLPSIACLGRVSRRQLRGYLRAVDPIRPIRYQQRHDFAQALLQRLEAKAPNASPDNSFALLLIDGMSVREEPVTHALQYALGKLTLFGGCGWRRPEVRKKPMFIAMVFYR